MPARKSAEPVSIADAVAGYLTHLETEGRRLTTLARYRAPLQRLTKFAAARGATTLDRVVPPLVDEYRTLRHPDTQPKTLANETRGIKQLLKHATTRGLIAADPLRDLKVGKPSPRAQPVYSLTDVARILNAAPESWRSIFGLLAFTGLRIGELAFLTWGDIDIEKRELHVRAKDGWQPKTGRDRTIPLSERALTILRGLLRRGRWVLQQRGGHDARQITERRALKELKKALKRAGIAAGKLHTFRHFFISYCANCGVQPLIVMRWVGQTDLATVLQYYHLSAEESQRAMASLPFAANVQPGGSDSNKDRNEDNGHDRQSS